MPKDYTSNRSKEIPVSTIGKLLKILETDKSVFSLGPGELDYASPPNVLKAVKDAMTKKETHYSPVGGREDLKEAIVKKLRKENGIMVGPENVIVTTGSTEGLLLGLMSTVDVGEGVMLTDPGFLAYKPGVEVLDGIPLSVKLHEVDGFQLTTEGLKDVIIPEKTKGLIINTPTNPTGTVYTKKTLEEVADFAVEHDLIIFSDEAYEKFVYEGKHISIGSLSGMSDRVVTLHSFSKTYAMPGFRVGYAVGEENIIKAMKDLHVFTTLCTPTVSQIAALEALKGPQKHIQTMVDDYNKRRLYMVKRLNDMIGVRCIKPHGAFYAFPNIDYFKTSSYKFAEKLLKKAKVAVIPGTEFGQAGEGFIRCSYATSMDKIKIALNRMENFVKGL
ncbi:MAG: pyridoxal phosphate-dependent aminotransferase [Candidatus Aenigmatarchaeota archaeon]